MPIFEKLRATTTLTEPNKSVGSISYIHSLFAYFQSKVVPVALYPRNTHKRRLAVTIFQVTAILSPLLLLFLAFFSLVDATIFATDAQLIIVTVLQCLAFIFGGVFVSLKHGRPNLARSLLTFAAFFIVLVIVQTTGGIRTSVAAVLITLPPLIVFYFFDIRAGIAVMVGFPILVIALDLGNQILGYPIPDVTSQANPTFNRMSVLATIYLIVNLCLISLFRSLKLALADQLGEHRQLSELASRDALTGIGNKRWFEKRFDAIADLVDQTKGQMIVFNIDLDKFKPINDKFGHAAGDQLLIQIAHRLRDLCGPNEIAARLGGDEFALIFVREISEKEVADLGRLIETTIAVPFNTKGHMLQVGGSVGYCIYPKHTNIRSSIMRHADQDMFRRKSKSREHSATEASNQ